MSATALFYLLDISNLDELRRNAEIVVKKGIFSKKVTDNYWSFLANNATELKGYEGTGFIYGNLLVYLEEQKNIDLTSNEFDEIAKDLVAKRGSSHFLFTHKQKSAYINQLHPTQYLLTEIQQFNRDFSGEEDEDTAKLTLDALQTLRQNLEKVQSENQILLLIVG